MTQFDWPALQAAWVPGDWSVPFQDIRNALQPQTEQQEEAA